MDANLGEAGDLELIEQVEVRFRHSDSGRRVRCCATSDIPEGMHGVPRRLLFVCAVLTIATALPFYGQQSPDNFHWVDFHSQQDQSVLVWVTNSLESQKWTAIREIGVEYDAALVVTTLRKTPQTPPSLDTFSIWSASLTDHSVKLILSGANLRLLDWMLFATGWPRDLGALYDDCNECVASTFLTAFYYDQRQHGWAARWMRGTQAIPLTTASAAQGVTVTSAYAVMAEDNGHEIVGSWNHFDYNGQKPLEDYVYLYDVDPTNYTERTQTLTGKNADALKRRICGGADAVSGLAHGQDSAMCQVYKSTPGRKTAR